MYEPGDGNFLGPRLRQAKAEKSLARCGDGQEEDRARRQRLGGVLAGRARLVAPEVDAETAPAR